MSLFQLFLYSCFVGIALARTEAEIKTWFLQQALQCAKEYPVTEEEILLLQKHIIPDTKNAKCLLACMFRKTEWFDDKGKFIEENAVKMSEQEHPDEPAKVENAKKLFDLCKKVNDETISGPDSDCERAAHLAKCLTQNAPKIEGANEQFTYSIQITAAHRQLEQTAVSPEDDHITHDLLKTIQKPECPKQASRKILKMGFKIE